MSTTQRILRYKKDSYLVQLAEYVVNNKDNDKLVFAQWLRHTLKKKVRIISKKNQSMYKYSIKILKSIQTSMKLYPEN